MRRIPNWRTGCGRYDLLHEGAGPYRYLGLVSDCLFNYTMYTSVVMLLLRFCGRARVYCTAVSTSNAPVPVVLGLPTTMLPDGLERLSKSP